MKPLKAPKHSLEENEIEQELAELETRLKQADPPTNTFEVRRRSFYEALARMWRQRLMVLKTEDSPDKAAAEIEPRLKPEQAPELRREPDPEADRRLTPRLETNLDAQLISPDGLVGPVRVLNLSRGGLAVAFGRDTLRTVFPDNQVLPGSVLTVRFESQDSNSPPQTIQAAGVVVWVQQVHEDQYRLGLRWG